MKKHLALMLCAGVIAGAPALAQRTCGTDAYTQQEELANPGLKQTRATIEKQVAQLIASGEAKRGQNTVITIPVVVHVVYGNANENISDALILGQINKLNEDYRKLNADASQAPAMFAPLAVDTEIEFCLAVRDPQGNPTTGITRTPTTVPSFNTNNAIKSNATGGKTGWDSSKYLNFWLGDLGSNLLGYAQFPGGPAANDGVVVHYGSVPGGFLAPYNLGRTATHEVGHWLNLSHVFSGGCAGGDNVADTPPQAAPNYGCPNFPSVSCNNGGDMFMNYMDYTDDNCMYMFSTGQKARMLASINASRPSLLTSNGCVPVNLQAIDASLTGVTFSPVGSVCSGTISPQVTLKNLGSSTLTSVIISYQIDNGNPLTYAWTGNLASLATTTVTLPDVTAGAGSHTFTATSTNPNNGTDGNPANDSATGNFSVTTIQGTVLAAPQGFESNTFPPVNWQLANMDNAITWERTTTAAALGSASMAINNYNYQTPGEKDDLVLPFIDLASIPNAKLTFDVAYKYYDGVAGTFTDSLQVLISTDCGQTYSTVYYNGGENLATGSGAGSVSTAFVPAGPADWRNEVVDLTPFLSSNSAMIRIRNITGYGNTMYIDNIMISSMVGREDDLALAGNVSLYPNPSSGLVTIQLAEVTANAKLDLQIVDVLGRVVAAQSGTDAAQTTFNFDLSHLPNGVYMAKINSAKANTVKRFVIAR